MTQMPTYMFQGSYSKDAIAAIRKDGGSHRVEVARALASSIGGTLESFYFAFGEWDFIAIAEVPDAASAVALASTIGASGAMSRFETTALLSPDEVDAASRITPTYTPPGG
jgi:uncharacterized protein with GYD domain